jgi:hypothetical protein
MLPSVKTLLGSIVDYAGVFPPAKLILQRAMANYVDYQSTPYRWMLNRFVLPVSQLEEFDPTFQLKQWELSLICSGNWKSEIETVQLLSGKNQITVTALEFPPLPPTQIKRLIPYLPSGVEAFFEIPLNEDPQTYLEVLKYTGTGAKIRTGGMTAQAFPSITQLYQYILSFANAQVAFKATAGLHHLLPGNYCLTYEPDSVSTLMHGFLNVTILGALAYWHKVTPQTSQEVLHESTTTNFQFTPDTISWCNHRLNIAKIKEARQRFFRSFGSCSFQEPVDNLKIFLSTPTGFTESFPDANDTSVR